MVELILLLYELGTVNKNIFYILSYLFVIYNIIGITLIKQVVLMNKFFHPIKVSTRRKLHCFFICGAKAFSSTYVSHNLISSRCDIHFYLKI